MWNALRESDFNFKIRKLPLHQSICRHTKLLYSSFVFWSTSNIAALINADACQSQGFFQGANAPPPWLWFVPPWIPWEIYFTCKSIQAFIKVNDTINSKLCLCKNSPRFHQIKGPKSKFSGRARPSTPLVCCMLCTQIRTCPPWAKSWKKPWKSYYHHS